MGPVLDPYSSAISAESFSTSLQRVWRDFWVLSGWLQQRINELVQSSAFKQPCAAPAAILWCSPILETDFQARRVIALPRLGSQGNTAEITLRRLLSQGYGAQVTQQRLSRQGRSHGRSYAARLRSRGYAAKVTQPSFRCPVRSQGYVAKVA